MFEMRKTIVKFVAVGTSLAKTLEGKRTIPNTLFTAGFDSTQ